MQRLAPVGPVYQAGTLSGNPLATAAGLATLRACTPEVYAAVDSFAGELSKLVSSSLDEAGVPHYLSTAGNLFTVFIGRTAPVLNFSDAKDQSTAAYAAFFHAMLDGGVYLPPSAFEAWFVSAAHDEGALARIADALPAAARAAAGAGLTRPHRRPGPTPPQSLCSRCVRTGFRKLPAGRSVRHAGCRAPGHWHRRIAGSCRHEDHARASSARR